MSRLHILNRTAATALYVVEFLISILILGIFSYFLAVLARRDNAVIPQWQKAVEGLSGASALYCIFAIIFTCFLGGITFFAFLAVILNVCFCGAMIAIAILTKAATKSCSSTFDDSPIGRNHPTSCKLQQVAFAVSIIGAFFYVASILTQVALSRSSKREKRYGPSPSNNYTSGSGKRRPWQRKKRAAADTELGATGEGAIPPLETSTQGNGTVANNVAYGGPNTKYAQPTVPAQQPTYDQGYGSQTTGVVPSSNTYNEMDATPSGTMTGGFGHEKPNPYAELHGSAK